VVLSLLAGVGPEYRETGNKALRWIAYDTAAKTIGKRFLREYRGLSCRAVTWARYGMWYNFLEPSSYERFLRDPEPNGCLCGDESTIARAARWGVEYVLEEMKHPRTEEQVRREHKLG
jgi:hypothetical protein